MIFMYGLMKSIAVDTLTYISEPIFLGGYILWGRLAGSEGMHIFRRYMDNLINTSKELFKVIVPTYIHIGSLWAF